MERRENTGHCGNRVEVTVEEIVELRSPDSRGRLSL
jgi:hypothetical protein